MSDLLQTSPYLTCISAGDASPIVYAIDEREPTSPDVTPLDGAVFGVIGLARNVVWHTERAALDALQHAARAPVARRSLIELYGIQVVSNLVSRGWLQRPDELCTEYLLTTAQIEVTAHCNWGCRFCPVSVDRKPSATMPMPLFEEIIEKISPYDTIRYVTFHFYNEPTLDRFFDDRLAVLRKHGLLLRLFTNASRLTEDRIKALKGSGVLDQLVVNLPSLQKDEFRALTQSKTQAASLRNLDAAVEHGLPVGIAVNGGGEDVRHRLAELRERYEPQGVPVNATLTSDRAGTVDGRYNQAVRIEGPLRGCGWPVNHAHFSVSGDMFICCNDYYQRETFGNIRSGSVHEIMTSPAALLVRRRVFGVADAPADYLCRSCHDQLADFPLRQFRPLATFPVCELRRRQGAPRA
ncbi:MAG TPA: radical SAM protein [Streptosporangiaceae bacterium]|nr:radical SAM protein [Streptosporangiaceae bacterium]